MSYRPGARSAAPKNTEGALALLPKRLILQRQARTKGPKRLAEFILPTPPKKKRIRRDAETLVRDLEVQIQELRARMVLREHKRVVTEQLERVKKAPDIKAALECYELVNRGGEAAYAAKNTVLSTIFADCRIALAKWMRAQGLAGITREEAGHVQASLSLPRPVPQ